MNRHLCVIIHGFTGNPREIEPLANALKRTGYEVVTPLLPGHNTKKERMQKATAFDWIQTIEKIVENAKKDNVVIHMIGFSMGAMIASLITSRYPISTLVLLSPSVYVGTPHIFVNRIKTLFQQYRENRALLGDTIVKNLSSMRLAPIYNVVQFQDVVRQAKKSFRNINIPICIIHGLKDEIVDPKSSEWIYRVVPSKEKELHYLPNSRHVICQDCEVDIVIQTVFKFLEKHR